MAVASRRARELHEVETVRLEPAFNAEHAAEYKASCDRAVE
mgnify:FL=1